MAETFNPTGEQLYNATLYTHDSAGEIVNPSTKEGQEAITALLEGLSKEDTLTLVKSALDALVAKDSATGARQDALKAAVDTLATEQKLELVRLLLVDIQSKLGSIDVASLPAISGEVSVSNLPATQQVAGAVEVTNLPLTQTVAGTVDVGNLPQTQQVTGEVTIGNLPEVQPVSGSVQVGNFPAVQEVSGSVSINNSNMTLYGADIADRPTADTVPVGATFTIANADLDTWISNGTDWVVV